MLGTLVGNNYAKALNDCGQVAGRAAAGTGDADLRAVVWENGSIQDLNTGVGPKLTVCWGINNASQILVGSSTSAYLLDGETLRSLGFEHGSALNDSGQVVGTRNTGQSDANGPIEHAVFWDNGTIQDLGTLGGKRSDAFGINSALVWLSGQRMRPQDRRTGTRTRRATGTPRGSTPSRSGGPDRRHTGSMIPVRWLACTIRSPTYNMGTLSSTAGGCPGPERSHQSGIRVAPAEGRGCQQLWGHRW